jgi:hypothetical protein
MSKDNLEQRIEVGENEVIKRLKELSTESEKDARTFLEKVQDAIGENKVAEEYTPASNVAPVKSRNRQILEAMNEEQYDYMIDKFYNGSIANVVSDIRKNDDLRFDLVLNKGSNVSKRFADYIIDLANSEDVFEKKEELLKQAIKVYEIIQSDINHAADVLRELYMNKSREDETNYKHWLSKYSNVRNLYEGV